MPDQVLHLNMGPNGAGKSTLYELVIEPAIHLDFVNAHLIAARDWPGDAAGHAYEAAAVAAARRDELLEARRAWTPAPLKAVDG